MRQTIAAIAVFGGLAAACASTPNAPMGPPDHSPLAGQPPSPHARLYADCLHQAAGGGSFQQVVDGGDELLLFTCSGQTAATFYAALGPHSERMESAFSHDGRSYRSTARVQRNLIGVDHCSVDSAGGDPRCVLTFNAGDFLIAGD